MRVSPYTISNQIMSCSKIHCNNVCGVERLLTATTTYFVPYFCKLKVLIHSKAFLTKVSVVLFKIYQDLQIYWHADARGRKK